MQASTESRCMGTTDCLLCNEILASPSAFVSDPDFDNEDTGSVLCMVKAFTLVTILLVS